MYHVIILSAILALGSVCQDEEFNFSVVELDENINETPSSRIVGGEPTIIERYPFTVQILRDNELACGGLLLTRRIVLSAAHCFVDDNGEVMDSDRFLIIAGSTLLGIGGSTHSVSTIAVHEEYDRPPNDNDVAVLVLSTLVELSASVAIAKIPASNVVVPDNATVIHVGWGITVDGSSEPSSVLNEVELRTVNLGVCRERYANFHYEHRLVSFEVSSNMICTGLLDVGVRDACQGDSGGPVIWNRGGEALVVGVTVGGYGCGLPTLPGVNVRTAAYTNWILPTVQRYSAAGKAAADKAAAGKAAADKAAAGKAAAGKAAAAPAAMLAALAAVLLTQYA